MVYLIIILQAMWYLSARKDALEEIAWSFPFRMFDWGTFQADKKPKSDEAHKQGALSVGILWIATALAFTAAMYPQPVWVLVLDFVLSFISFLLVYWRYFDIDYASGIGQSKFYLGGTARLDMMLKKKYGENAGKKKALFCLFGIAVCDAVLILLYYIA